MINSRNVYKLYFALYMNIFANVTWKRVTVNCPYGSPSPLDSILLAVFTVSPNRQYLGIFSPTTPAQAAPTHIQYILIYCSSLAGRRRRKWAFMSYDVLAIMELNRDFKGNCHVETLKLITVVSHMSLLVDAVKLTSRDFLTQNITWQHKYTI